MRLKSGSGQGARGLNHYYYGHYYASQAMFFAGDEYWPKWFPWVRKQLIEKQDATGKWKSQHGDAYATAMALLILQVPNRLLPIFQK